MTLLLRLSPLIFSTVLGLFLAFFILRIRYVPGSRSLGTLVLAATLWSAGYALEFLSPALGGKLFWAKFQYLGITAIPVAWLVFAHRYLESHEWPRSVRVRLLLGLIPALTLILVWTNEAHHLVWRETHLQPIGPIQILAIVHGPWFWVFWAYSYGLIVFGSLKLIRTLTRSSRLNNWQIRLALIATAIPWLGNLLYVLGLSPVDYLDLTPFGFVLAGLILAVSLFRFQLANIPPIAHQQVFGGQADKLVVLDLQNFIVDLNPAARQLIKGFQEEPIGKPLARVFPELAPWAEKASLDGDFQTEMADGEAPGQNYYHLHISPLAGAGPRPVGRLIVLHEITQLKQEQGRLERARTQLEQVVSQRTEELNQTVQRLEVELAHRTLAEQRLQELIESAPDGMLLVDRGGVIRLVNAQTERLFGYARSELLGQSIGYLMAAPQRGHHEGYIGEFFAQPAIRHISSGLNYTAQRKDGSRFPAEVSLGPVNTVDGIWAACSVRDVTERKKAEEEINQSREELRALAVRLQEVQEIERREIARELHDRIGQNLTGLNLNLQIVENQLDPVPNAAVLDRLDDSLNLVEETTRQVRDVMADLHPPALDEYGLLAALHWYGGVFARRTGIAPRVTGTEFAPRLPPNVELALFRIVQEALNNVVKHARCSQVVIELEASEEAASLTVQDDGAGFEIPAVRASGRQTHWGLIHMQQRAASIGGQLTVESAPGRGTRIRIDLPRLRHDH